MSIVTELFGIEVLNEPLEEVKKKIKNTPYVKQSKYGFILKDYADAKGIKLTKQDYEDVGALPK